MTDSGTKNAWIIHESNAVQIYVHNDRRCFYVPRVPGIVKNPHNYNSNSSNERLNYTLVNDNYVDNYLKEILAFAYCGSLVNNLLPLIPRPLNHKK